MLFVILGVVIAFVAFFVSKTNPQFASMGLIGRFIGLGLVAVGLASACFVQIEPGQVGVQTLFGKVQSKVLREGLNVVNPLVDVVYFDVRTQNYTMSGIQDEGNQKGDDAIHVLTSDGLQVVIDLSVLYHIVPDQAPVILQTIGRDITDKIVRPLSRTKIRDNAVFYDAISLYSSKRDEFQQKIFADIEKDFAARGIVLEQLLIRNITLPESVRRTIESKINAEQESQKMRFVLEKEKQEAERKRVEAQGIADYQRIITSSLSNELLQYEQIKAQKELALSNNAKVVIMSGKNVPILVNQ